jgi:oligopeptide/dipeptide ABC transporter ATP-binding protein
LGKIVELAPTTSLFEVPMHPYTRALMGAVPEADPRRKAAMVPVIGEVPSPASPPAGCHFHQRCPHATELCKTTMPILEEISSGQFVRCHRAEELAVG